MRILVLPRSTNPYQSLLYNPMSSRVTISYGFGQKWLRYLYPFVLIHEKFKGTKIIHIHWPYWLTIRLPNKTLRLFFSSVNILLFVYLAKILGFRLVRTMHNLVPHEQQTFDDIYITKLFASHSAATIVHSKQTTAEMEKLGISTEHNVIIPIGSYENVYTNVKSSSASRKILGIRKNEFVILFFGIIRDYKGVDDLINSYRLLKYKDLHLVIAGLCDEPELWKHLQNASEGLNVTFYNEFIPNEKVEIFFQACDVVCLPFKRITTSSSVLLAMAFEKAVITPRIGTLLDMPTDAAVFYDPKKSSLESIIGKVIEDKSALKKIARTGKQYSKLLSWDLIANQTYNLYKEIEPE